MSNKKYIGKVFEDVKKELDNKGLAKKSIIFQKKVKIGYEDKNPIYLEVEIRENDLNTQAIFNIDGKILYIGSKKQTIDHKYVDKYKELSLSASSKYFAGQAIDEVKKLIPINPKLKRVVEIWEEYHLNDTQPNCIHQESFNCNCEDFKEKAENESNKCPMNYKYGSKWLLKELPEDIEKEIIQLTKEVTQ